MKFTEKCIKFPVDIGSRFAHQLAYKAMELESAPYIATLERNVKATSIIGLLSLNVHKDDVILIQVVNDDENQAKQDLDTFVRFIMGDE